jgi:Nod factor-specific ABC transporter NodJ protein
MFGYYPVFLREMMLFRRRFLRLGYFFSAMFAPLLYLLAFGLGLGHRISIAGGSYLDFLLPGLIAMSSMNNSYTWIATSLTVGRLHFRTFQFFIQSPVSPGAIVLGEVLAGMVRGLFASSMIILVGFFLGSGVYFIPLFIPALLLNCFLFASLGVVSGLRAKSHEDTATFSNFFILPMAFFGGTFFPIEEMPRWLQFVIRILPLAHTNKLMRAKCMESDCLLSLAVLVIFAVIFFVISIYLVRTYSE